MRIRMYRKAAGMTQEELAETVGIVRSSIANTEAGRQNFSLRRLGRIADALGVAPGTLVGEAPDDETIRHLYTTTREQLTKALQTLATIRSLTENTDNDG